MSKVGIDLKNYENAAVFSQQDQSLEGIDYKELLTISEKFEDLIIAHIDWANNIQKRMICDLSIPKELIGHHKHCEFGKWYYSVEHPQFNENEAFKNLGHTHKNLHATVDNLLGEYKKHKRVKESTYNEFTEIQHKFMVECEELNRKVLVTKGQIDPLTNLVDRRLLLSVMEKEHSKVIRHNNECCIGFVDIDHFKTVNDTHGHLAGDKVLKAVSQYLNTSLRKYDTVGRYGGEEFIICMPETSLSDAKLILERMRSGLEKFPIQVDGSTNITLTCSFGLVEMKTDEKLEESINKADKAMYMAKEAGRNKLYTWHNSTMSSC